MIRLILVFCVLWFLHFWIIKIHKIMFNLHDYAVYCQFKIIGYSKCVKLDMNQCEIW